MIPPVHSSISFLQWLPLTPEDKHICLEPRYSISATLLAEYSADSPVPHSAQFVGAAVSLDSIGADGMFITGVLPAATFILFCTEVIHTNVSRDTVTAMSPRQVDTDSIGVTVMHFRCTLINILMAGRVSLDTDVTVLALMRSFCIPVFAL